MIDYSWRRGAADVEFAAKNAPVSSHRPHLGVTPSSCPRQWARFPTSDCAQPVHAAFSYGPEQLVLHTNPAQVADARSVQQLQAGHKRGNMQSGVCRMRGFVYSGAVTA
jgi:hypothetical protein